MYKYPKEVVSDIYVSRVGGFCEEINANEIGININAIYTNTSIIPEETFCQIKFFDEPPKKPFFFRKKFRIVGIDESMESYRITKDGEVVLSKEYEAVFRNKVGEAVIINTVESFRIDGDYSKIAKYLVRACRLDDLLRRN